MLLLMKDHQFRGLFIDPKRLHYRFDSDMNSFFIGIACFITPFYIAKVSDGKLLLPAIFSPINT